MKNQKYLSFLSSSQDELFLQEQQDLVQLTNVKQLVPLIYYIFYRFFLKFHFRKNYSFLQQKVPKPLEQSLLLLVAQYNCFVDGMDSLQFDSYMERSEEHTS